MGSLCLGWGVRFGFWVLWFVLGELGGGLRPDEVGEGVDGFVVVPINTLKGKEEFLTHFSPRVNAYAAAAAKAIVANKPTINAMIDCGVQSLYSMGCSPARSFPG